MQVSTKLFNDQQIRQFGKLTADIQEKQEKIASGKAILRASDDPVTAVELSAAREQEQLLSRFEDNAYNYRAINIEFSDYNLFLKVYSISNIYRQMPSNFCKCK